MDENGTYQQPIRALVVAASPDWQRAYADTCERLKCEVHTVSSGFEAVDRLRDGRYDLVVGDDSLDDLSLFELNLYVKDFALGHSEVVLAGLDGAGLPHVIRQDKKLHLLASPRQIIEHLPNLLAAMVHRRRSPAVTQAESMPVGSVPVPA